MSGFDVDRVVGELRTLRREWRDAQKRQREPAGREFPSPDALAAIVGRLKGALFPLRLGPADLRQDGEDFYVAHTLNAALHGLLEQARLELGYVGRHAPPPAEAIDAQARRTVHDFAAALPGIRRLLDSDVVAAYQGDPAANSVDEVLLCYP
ncbi:MAG: serine acetyltransferase, partial [Lautropia sp.]